MVIYEADVSGSKYTNQQTAIHTVDDAIRTLDTDRDNFVLLPADAARYMTVAGRVVKQTYPRLFHTICKAHDLHNGSCTNPLVMEFSRSISGLETHF